MTLTRKLSLPQTNVYVDRRENMHFKATYDTQLVAKFLFLWSGTLRILAHQGLSRFEHQVKQLDTSKKGIRGKKNFVVKPESAKACLMLDKTFWR